MSRAFEREWNILIFRCANKDRLAKHILNEKKVAFGNIWKYTKSTVYMLYEIYMLMATNIGECTLVRRGVGKRWFRSLDDLVILSLL